MIKKFIPVLLLCILISCTGPVKKETWVDVEGSEKLVAVWYETSDGTKHGKITKWLLNGQIRLEAEMVHGVPDGEWKMYYETGKPWYYMSWKEGEFQGQIALWSPEGERKDFKLEKLENSKMWHMKVSRTFLKDFNLKLKAGRAFLNSIDDYETVMINDAAATAIGGSPLGKKLKEKRIIGVTEGFYWETDKYFRDNFPIVFTLEEEQ